MLGCPKCAGVPKPCCDAEAAPWHGDRQPTCTLSFAHSPSPCHGHPWVLAAAVRAQRTQQDLTCPRRPTRRGSARLCPGRSRHRPAAPTRWRRCWAASSSCPCWRGSGRRPGGPAAPPRRNLAPCPSPPALRGEDGVSKGSASPRGGTGVLPPAHPKTRPGATTVLEKGFCLFVCFWGVPGHSLRDTWMSSVTLNTPEVTKLSWKSVESAQERGEGAESGWGARCCPRAPHISPGHPWERGG